MVLQSVTPVKQKVGELKSDEKTIYELKENEQKVGLLDVRQHKRSVLPED